MSDVWMLRTGILIAGVLLLAAIVALLATTSMAAAQASRRTGSRSCWRSGCSCASSRST